MRVLLSLVAALACQFPTGADRIAPRSAVIRFILIIPCMFFLRSRSWGFPSPGRAEQNGLDRKREAREISRASRFILRKSIATISAAVRLRPEPFLPQLHHFRRDRLTDLLVGDDLEAGIFLEGEGSGELLSAKLVYDRQFIPDPVRL